MKFVVGNTVTDDTNNGPIPEQLATLNRPAEHAPIDHSFIFQRNADGHWSINNITFHDVVR